MNPLLILIIIIILFFSVRGAATGLLRMIYTVIAWLFFFYFMSIATPYIHECLVNNTNVEELIYDKVNEVITEKYATDEGYDSGISILLPEEYTQGIENQVEESRKAVIDSVTSSVTTYMVNIFSKFITVIIALLIIWLIGLIIQLIGAFPLLRGPNKILGFVLGCIKGLILIWFIFYLSECFPDTTWGRFVNANITESPILMEISSNNIVSKILK